MPFGGGFTVEVGDSSYSKPAYLHSHRQFPNLVTTARVRGNRVFYRQYVPTEEEMTNPGSGHPTWYGERFSLSDPETWGKPNATLTLQETSRQGKVYRVELQAWQNLLMTGKHKPVRLPMHKYPFTVRQSSRRSLGTHCAL